MTYTDLQSLAKAEFESIRLVRWESSFCADLKGIKHNEEYQRIEEVPLNKTTATLYAIEVLRPDNTKVIYLDNYNKSLRCRPGSRVSLNYSGDIGIVSKIKNRWTGKVICFGDADYDSFIPFNGIK